VPLYFAHANGYPPAAYAPFLNTLTPHYQVEALLFRPLWPNADPKEVRDWNLLAEDQKRFIQERGAQPIIAVGHSLGAITTLALALRQPELFRAIVLIDPVLFRRRLLWAWRVVRTLGLGRRFHPLIPTALRRRRVFTDQAEMYERYRRAPVFSRLSDENLRLYVAAMAKPRPDGQVELAYSPEWEVTIYETGPLNLWKQLPQLRVPLLVVWGEDSDTFLPVVARRVQKLLPQASVQGVPGVGHLVPLEKPQETGEKIVEFLKRIQA